MLALLACARRGLSRDRLIGYLWAETDGEKARRLLSESLYILRKELGEDAILVAGDELRLNATVVQCDVVAFDDAIAGGDFALAASLYAGPFLDGFYVSDAAELERWIEIERGRLGRDYRRAVEKLAEAAIAEGRHDDAVTCWRRLTEQDPFSGRFALGLMQSLDAAGHRADALKHARVHATLLREELDADPDPDVVALAERIRESPEPAKMADTQVQPVHLPLLPDPPARPDPEPQLAKSAGIGNGELSDSGTVTFLFSDIEGSTALLRRLGPRYAELLANHHAIIREAVRQSHGRELDTAGDGFFIAFPRARDAITAAVRIQRRIFASDWPDGLSVRVRVGLHTGEPALTLTGYIGMDVHRASRICSAARGGQIVMSSTTRELVAGDIPAGLGLRDLGLQALKDIDEPEHLYELVFQDAVVAPVAPPAPGLVESTRAAGGAPARAPASFLRGSGHGSSTAARPRRGMAYFVLALAVIGTSLVIWRFRSTTQLVAYRGPIAATRTVAILPATVHGDPELEYLGKGIVSWLTAQLDGAGDIRPIDSHALLAFVGDRSPDPPLARSVSRRFDARYYVLTDIIRGGPDHIRINATVYDRDSTMSSPGIATTVPYVEGSPASVPELLRDLTTNLLVVLLGESSTDLDRIALRTSASFDAVKEWLLGQQEFLAARYGAAAEAYQRAVDIDSTFGLAYYRLSMAREWNLQFQPAHTAADNAMRHIEGLSARQRTQIFAWNDLMNGDAAAAIAKYEGLTSASPDDVEAWYGLGEAFAHFNTVGGSSVGEAIAPFRHVLDLMPNYGDARLHLLEYAAADRDSIAFDSLLVQIDRTSDQWFAWQAVRAFGWDDAAEQTRVVGAVRGRHVTEIGTAAVRVAAHLHEFDGARRLAALLDERGTSSADWRAAGRILTAQLHFAAGAFGAAATVLAAVDPDEPDWTAELRGLFALPAFTGLSRDELAVTRESIVQWTPGQREARFSPLLTHVYAHGFLRPYLLGMLSIRLNDEDAARRYLTELQRKTAGPEGRTIKDLLDTSLRAHLLALAGQPQPAINLLRNVERHGWIEQVGFSPFYSRAYDRLVLAELLRLDGQDEEALSWYRSLTEGYEVLFVAPAHYRMAQIYQRLDQPDSAQLHRREYERLWAGADPALVNGLAASDRW